MSELASCPACGRNELHDWRGASASDSHLTRQRSYRLLRCGACGTATTAIDRDEDPTRLHNFGTYSAARRWPSKLIEPLRRLTEIDRLRFLGDLEPGSRVLEVGAGDGRFLALLAARGFSASGIEPSPPSTDVTAADRPGPKIERATIEAAVVGPASQDAIVIWHVLEHVADPAAALARLRSWLRPGGRLIVGVPNRASLQAAIGGDRWFHQDVPRHRTHFTTRGLGALLGRVGFGQIRISHLLVEHNSLGMWQTMLNRITAERDFAFRLLKRDLEGVPWPRRGLDLALSVIGGALLLGPSVLLELIAGLARRGGTVVAVAKAL